MASITTTSMSLLSLSDQSMVSCARISGPSSVSLSIKGRNFPSIALQPKGRRFHVTCAAKPETVQKVCDIVKKQLALSEDSTITGESKFTALGADSLDTVEIVMGLEEEFGISVEEESAQTITTVQEAADMIDKLLETKA
ncbi:putative Acyl carrier protein (ACP) [Medicago truncatula]|uniref:Acyl carrier protein n=1 Tax=Medicago truncatula TaxID=3880 RepID=B7FHC3_MEDTR|nr:acyl carrier protein 1, chloroplastic [Medicago truncatula]ACJ84152.1 unknown [Medicago truncatula]KEH36709.1 acyl carrier protein [Medicago truncatula]RHN72329.1 putative Acyl carrier protein (ACP) [Medicago truncatula]